MDRVHEGVHGPGPQGWSMDLGSMFCIRPEFLDCIPFDSNSLPIASFV